MHRWNLVLDDLRREIATLTSARKYRSNNFTAKHFKLWEMYLQHLRQLRDEMKAWAANHSPDEYAAKLGVSLPPHPAALFWTDFVPAAIVEAFRSRQATCVNEGIHFKEMFVPSPPPRGQKTKERLHNQMIQEYGYNESLLIYERANNPEATFGTRRKWQIETARRRLDELPPNAKLPKEWLQLLLPHEREMDIDDTPRTIRYTPPSLAPAEDYPSYKKPGRKPGQKDSKPRKRRASTQQELQARHARKERREHQADLAAQRRLGIDPYKEKQDD